MSSPIILPFSPKPYQKLRGFDAVNMWYAIWPQLAAESSYYATASARWSKHYLRHIGTERVNGVNDQTTLHAKKGFALADPELFRETSELLDAMDSDPKEYLRRFDGRPTVVWQASEPLDRELAMFPDLGIGSIVGMEDGHVTLEVYQDPRAVQGHVALIKQAASGKQAMSLTEFVRPFLDA